MPIGKIPQDVKTPERDTFLAEKAVKQSATDPAITAMVPHRNNGIRIFADENQRFTMFVKQIIQILAEFKR